LKPWYILAIVWVLAFDLAFLWQRSIGAHRSEFGGHPEEAAHYVKALMVRDYCAGGFPGSMKAFAENYAGHYPSVLSEATPPLFHFAQGAWTLLFGTGRTSVMLFLATIAATLATLLVAELKREVPIQVAVITAIVFISLPLVREYYALVMPDFLAATLIFAAAICFNRFLEKESVGAAVGFGVLSGAAILTSRAGLSLILIIPLALLFAGRLRLLARPVFWGGIAIAVLLAGPWTRHLVDLSEKASPGVKQTASWQLSGGSLLDYTCRLGLALGAALAILVCVGLFARVVQRGPDRSRWAAFAAVILGVLLGAAILPGPVEARHLLPLLPAAVMFAAAGAVALQEWTVSRWKAAKWVQAHAVASGILVLAAIGGELTVRALGTAPAKHWTGFERMADDLLRDNAAGGAAIMISSDQTGEGVFIAEVAMREKRPSLVIKRSSRELVRAPSTGREDRPRFETEDTLADWFATAGVGYLVVDESIPDEVRGQHNDQAIRAVDTHSERFWPVTKLHASRSAEPGTGALTLYRVKTLD
jgi:hypothetical protein